MMPIIHYAFILSIAWLVFKKWGAAYPRLFWISFLSRVAVGAVLGLVYLYYYSANDTWIFFNDATILAQFGWRDVEGYLKFLFFDEAPGYLLDQLINSQERSLFLIKIMSLISWLGGDTYWVSAAWFSLISFLAAWYLFSVITFHFEKSWVAAAIAFLFFPSIVFWSSGLVKETMALAGIYFVSGIFLKFRFNQKVRWFEWILALGGCWVAWNLKYYWAAMFIATIITYLLVFLLRIRIPFIKNNKIATWIVIFVLLCAGVSFSHPNFYPHRFLEVLLTNHDEFVRISKDDGLIHFYQLHASWGSVILNAPWALFSGILRPFLGEASGLMAALASVENMVIMVLLISAMARIRILKSPRLLLLSVGVYIVVLCVFLALSTPNLGTLSRYRIGFLPFLIFMISYRNPLLDYLINRFRFLQS